MKSQAPAMTTTAVVADSANSGRCLMTTISRSLRVIVITLPDWPRSPAFVSLSLSLPDLTLRAPSSYSCCFDAMKSFQCQ